MSTRRPRPPQHVTPNLVPLAAATRFSALPIIAMLAGFNWTSTYRPDRDPFGHLRQRRNPDTSSPSDDSPDPGDQAGTDAAGDTHPDGQTGAAGPDCQRTSGSTRPGAHPGRPDPAADVDEETDTAQRFVAVALDGGFGEHHRQAAQTAVTVATEHGFVDDPKRVAEALVVFLHPDHR